MNDEELERYFSKMSNTLFPGWREEAFNNGKKIHKSLSFDISLEACTTTYFAFKALMRIYKPKLKYNVSENLTYFLWYIQRKIGKSIDISQSYDFIECCMKNDFTLNSIMGWYWFYSPYEKKLSDNIGENYWYNIDNPIWTAWICYEDLYLDRLCTEDWKHIKYNRVKWIPNPNLWESYAIGKQNQFLWLNQPPYRVVDEYEIFDESWKVINKLYICPYYNATSTVAPKWFILSE